MNVVNYISLPTLPYLREYQLKKYSFIMINELCQIPIHMGGILTLQIQIIIRNTVNSSRKVGMAIKGGMNTYANNVNIGSSCFNPTLGTNFCEGLGLAPG